MDTVQKKSEKKDGSKKALKFTLIVAVVGILVIVALLLPKQNAEAIRGTNAVMADKIFYINVVDPVDGTQYHIAVSDLVRNVFDQDHDQYGLWLEASVTTSPLPQEAQQ